KDQYNISSILNEGIATWWGGSSGKDLVWHIQLLKNKLKEKQIDLNNFSKEDNVLTAFSNLHSTIGGILTEQAYKMYGKEKLWELMGNSNSEELLYQNICKVFGVQRGEIGKLI